MSNNQLILTDRHLDVLALSLDDRVRLITLEGPARSSKTALLIQCFYFAVYSSPMQDHAICARTLDIINRNILNADVVGLMVTHKDVAMKKERVGGYFLEMVGKDGKVKRIFLVGYKDKSSWKNILGATLGVALVDESNIADPDLIRELFARQLSSDKPKTFYSLNGDDPNNTIYQEHINYCKIVGKAPISIMAEMTEFQQKNGRKKGYYYSHFTMYDNPVMTPEKIKDAESIYPVGSYYYTTKILGERAAQGVLIFYEYMSNDLIIDAYARDELGRRKYEFYRFTIGADIGETSAYNVFTLVGWIKGYSKAVILRVMSFKRVGYQAKQEKLKEFLKLCINENEVTPETLEGIYVDSAEANFIYDLKIPIMNEFGFKVKSTDKEDVIDRISMNIVGFSSKRLLIHYTADLVYNSYRAAKWAEDKIGKEREDLGLELNDVMDSTEYALEMHMIEFSMNKNR